MVRHEGIKVDLPAAEQSEANQQIFKSIAINKDNELFFDQSRTRWPDLIRDIKALKTSHGDDLVIYISADKASQHEYFVKVLDALKSNGITNVNIETSGSE